MKTALRLKEFTENKILLIDNDDKNCKDVMQKFKISAMRVSYSKVLHF